MKNNSQGVVEDANSILKGMRIRISGYHSNSKIELKPKEKEKLVLLQEKLHNNLDPKEEAKIEREIEKLAVREWYINDMSIEDEIKIRNISSNLPDPVVSYLEVSTDNGVRTKISINSGLTVIVGASNTGKSMLCGLLDKKGFDVVKFHEPDKDAIINESAMIEILEQFLVSNKQALVIDSFRFFVYNADSRAPAMSGGISSTLFTEITRLAQVAMLLKKKLVIVINFLQKDKNIESVWDSLIGSANAVIMTQGVNQQDASILIRYSSRDDATMRNEIVGIVNLTESPESTGTNSKGQAKVQEKRMVIESSNREVNDNVLNMLRNLIK